MVCVEYEVFVHEGRCVIGRFDAVHHVEEVACVVQ